MNINKKQQQTECNRCGICCTKGGPALHSQDLQLVIGGGIPRNSLITIRKGELAYNPKTATLKPVSCELIKIKGQGGDWRCMFYDESVKGCGIYQHRPFACTVLECWNPKELLELVEKDTLTRFDILKENDPMYSFVVEYERLFPCPDLEEIAGWNKEVFQRQAGELENMVGDDLAFRNRLVRQHGLKLDDELLLFGRPLFQLLQPLGFSIIQGYNGIKLQFSKR